jgi:hypothetical protein
MTTGHRFETKDSGKRETWDTGAQRDTEDGKGRYDLIPAGPVHRLAQLYQRGAVKYEDNNWKKGIPTKRFMSSLLRHAFQYLAGDRSEDHLAAVAFNAFGAMYNEEQEEPQLTPNPCEDCAYHVQASDGSWLCTCCMPCTDGSAWKARE